MWRRIVQILSAIGINSNFSIFKNFGIYQGPFKRVCAPVLNCYACPLARFSCPIGSLQHFIGIRKIPYYILGYIGTIGMFVGRSACGWLCPFGFIQELLYKIGNIKIRVGKWAGYVKYIVLIIIIPVVYFTTEPWFCKICPAGTLEGTIPIMISPMWEPLSQLISWRFYMKLSILVIFVISAILIKRPFCRFMCPLGAMWGLFNRISALKLKVEKHYCQECDICGEVCPMDIRIYKDPNHFDCIRCMRCVTACPGQMVSVEIFDLKIWPKQEESLKRVYLNASDQ